MLDFFFTQSPLDHVSEKKGEVDGNPTTRQLVDRTGQFSSYWIRDIKERGVCNHVNTLKAYPFSLYNAKKCKNMLKQSPTVEIVYNEPPDITSKFGAEVWSRI